MEIDQLREKFLIVNINVIRYLKKANTDDNNFIE